jgi:hypothetical protein
MLLTRQVVATKAKKTARKTSATQTRDRTLPTEKYFLNGYPQKLFIYKLEASSFWWVRYYANGKVLRKTTKKEGKREAIAFAKDFYDTVTRNVRQGMITSSPANFEIVTKAMMLAEKAKLDRSELTEITYKNLHYRYNKSILPFFRYKDLPSVDYHTLETYLGELSRQNLSSSTISAYMRLVRKVMVYAARRRLITALPEFPTVTVIDKARGWFSVGQYNKLWHAAQRYVGEKVEVRRYAIDGVTQTQYILASSTESKLGKLMRNVEMTEDMRRLIVFMCNSYIRPTDIKFMQHKHVDVIANSERKYLRLRIPPTKGHGDPIITMAKAVDVYLKLREYHKTVYGSVGDNDYVFMPNYGEQQRNYALKQLQRQFEVLMWDTGLGTGSDGEERTLYSLRHTAIMYRLLFGESINTLVLARNARTSVEMIDRFYAKPLSGEMNIDMLQSRRRKRKIYDGD